MVKDYLKDVNKFQLLLNLRQTGKKKECNLVHYPKKSTCRFTQPGVIKWVWNLQQNYR